VLGLFAGQGLAFPGHTPPFSRPQMPTAPPLTGLPGRAVDDSRMIRGTPTGIGQSGNTGNTGNSGATGVSGGGATSISGGGQQGLGGGGFFGQGGGIFGLRGPGGMGSAPTTRSNGSSGPGVGFGKDDDAGPAKRPNLGNGLGKQFGFGGATLSTPTFVRPARVAPMHGGLTAPARKPATLEARPEPPAGPDAPTGPAALLNEPTGQRRKLKQVAVAVATRLL
jgi:hypothetical protein